jgi:hypothetical protein
MTIAPDQLADVRACIAAADTLLTEWIATGRTDHMDNEWQDLRHKILYANIQLNALAPPPKDTPQ